jgi:hypothetical protein
VSILAKKYHKLSLLSTDFSLKKNLKICQPNEIKGNLSIHLRCASLESAIFMPTFYWLASVQEARPANLLALGQLFYAFRAFLLPTDRGPSR